MPSESLALLHATLEATHDGIMVVDLQGRIRLWNTNALRMLGVSAETMTDGVEAVNAAIATQLNNGDELRESSRRFSAQPDREVSDTLHFKDGRVYQCLVAPHRTDGGVAWLVVSVHDVTHAVEAQREVEQQCGLLEKAQEVAHVGSWVAELDGSDRVTWSRETYRIFGVAPGAFRCTRTAFYNFVHPDDREAVEHAVARAIEQDEPYEADHRIVRSDGSVRWVHARGDVERNDGRPVRLVGAIQDITDRRQLEDQLRQAQKMEAIGRLAGGIAHDINNALTAIAGYAELTLSEVERDHPARADVEEIHHAAERAASVTKQLLAFSRKQLMEPRLFNLNDTVASIARLLSRIVGHDIAVRLQLGDRIPAIVGDPGQIEQAIVNLAVNARDAMPGGGEIVLETSFAAFDAEFARTHVPMPPGEYVRLAVHDTGQGMAAETQARIFEPFFTTKPAGKGTGLGLSMVYGTMKQIGGFIFVSSVLGKGTTFTMYFRPAPERAAAVIRREETAARATILIAEDETPVRNLVAAALRDEYDLLVAASAEAALELADSCTAPIDLLLTDAVMPGKSGVELAATLVARWPSLRVVFMSGYTDEPLSVAAAARPASVLQKPFTPRDLRQRVRDILAAS